MSEGRPGPVRAADDDRPRALAEFRHLTQARIALGRAGSGIPTRAALRFNLDHARAREAVWTPFDHAALGAALHDRGIETIDVASEAQTREIYLRRPDLGRRLSAASREALAARGDRPCDLAIVVADGLSATAVALNAPALVEALGKRAAARGWTLAPVAIARQARVAIGDPVGEALGARCVMVLIGERPGLSAADSLGCYLTHDPRPGLPDSRRNCISNIREGGLAIEAAADLAADLIEAMLRQGTSGVQLARDAAAPALGAG